VWNAIANSNGDSYGHCDGDCDRHSQCNAYRHTYCYINSKAHSDAKV